MKKIILSFVAFAMMMCSFSGNTAYANESINEIETVETDLIDEQGKERSGGLVSREYVVTSVSNTGQSWEYLYLTNSWAKASQYEVTTSVSKSSSNTLSIGVVAELKSKIQTQFGYTYGSVSSSSSSIGTTIPADSSRYSKLAFRVLVKSFYATVKVVDTYYDTSSGYYTYESSYSGYVYIPVQSQSYVDVVYQ